MTPVYRIALIEVWERYSFFSVYMLLPLFLTAAVSKGGFGWSGAEALTLFGLYLAATQVLPFFCGFITDSWLGLARALQCGSALMFLGHVLMASPHALPLLVDYVAGTSVAAALVAGGAPLGHGAAPQSFGMWEAAVYEAVSYSFYAALGLIAIGNGLFKPSISVLVGRLPFATTAARDAAFSTVYMYVNVGAVVAGLLGGFVASRFGWHWAFAAAGIAMGIAWLLLIFFRRHFAALMTPAPVPDQHGPEDRLASGWRFLTPLSALALICVLFGIAYLQFSGAVGLFSQAQVNREYFGFTIPVPWLTALNPICVIAFTPIIARNWRRGRGLGHNWSTTQKFTAGFVLVAVAFLLLSAAAWQAEVDGAASLGWIVAAFVVMTLGELFVAPVGIAAVSRLSPPERQTIAMGIWFAAIGIAAWASGRVGAFATGGREQVVFLIIAATVLLCAAVMRLCRPWFARHGA